MPGTLYEGSCHPPVGGLVECFMDGDRQSHIGSGKILTGSSNTRGMPVRITSKGQVTIPQAIREKAGLLPNTEVEFEMKGGRVLLRPAGKPATRTQEAIGRLRGTLKHIRMSTDQIMALTRGKD